MRRLLVPGLSTLVMLGVLLFLGGWQVQRGTWKRAVLAEIAAAEVLPAVPMPVSPAMFTKVKVEGVLRFDRAALYGAEGRDIGGKPVMGAQLLVPLERAGMAPLLVLMGWVPGLLGDGVARAGVVEGYVRAPEVAGWFSAADDVKGRRFYTLDPLVIGPALGIGVPAPMVLVALGPAAMPDPAHTLPRPSNNHLSYAITWFGLAAGLVGVFLVYARKVLRS